MGNFWGKFFGRLMFGTFSDISGSFIFALCFLFGIFVGDFMSGYWLEIGVFLLFFLIILRLRFLIIFIAVLAFGLGFWRFSIASTVLERGPDLRGYHDFLACVTEFPEIREESIQYVVFSEDFQARILLVAPRYPPYLFGQCLRISGEIKKPEKIQDFDYARYLQLNRIGYLVYYPKIEAVRTGSLEQKSAKLEDYGNKDQGVFSGNFIFNFLYKLRLFSENSLNRIFPEPHSSLMSGLILGIRSGLPENFLDDFNRTGLTHIVAISGYNITLIIILVNGMLAFLSRRSRVMGAILLIILFVILVGASASVVRAAIMGVLALFAVFFGRIYSVTLALIYSAFLMCLWNPFILTRDVGFQFSFLATMGLIYFSPLVGKYLNFLPEFLAIRDSVVMTLSAQILVLPLIIFYFGKISLISVVANVFVLPFIPLAMFFGFGSLVISFFAFSPALFVGFWGYLIVDLILREVAFFAKFPFASIEFGKEGIGIVIAYYLLIGMIFWSGAGKISHNLQKSLTKRAF